MFELKMSGELYDDVKLVSEAISRLHGMLEYLEQECIEQDKRDKRKTASDTFIYINDIRRGVGVMVETSKKMLRAADIQQYGELSKYVRPYLG